MKRSHPMPFGTEPAGSDRTRFRLWAPAARAVTLLIENESAVKSEAVPLSAGIGGWWQTVAAAPAGTLYRYQIDGTQTVPDPASRFNPLDVAGPSEVIDAAAFEWHDGGWRGRPWEEAVIYELHVGTFSPAGTFAGVTERLDYLAALGVTAIELMPVADFPGRRGWGYDGVLPYAPDASYGRPDHLKRLVESAHARRLMVFLDVVYNHFGLQGNYLHVYAPQFFTQRHQTPWGAGINFDGKDARTVRDFFIHNALYWLDEFHLDGLRLDAVHAIADDSVPHILVELASAVRDGPGRNRHVHLILENDRNEARYLRRESNGVARCYTAQWNDDLHHAFHVLLAGESDGYYADYARDATPHLGRCLTQGFAYQGEISPFRAEMPRGEPSAHLPPAAFVSFLQTHDQVGNRALGERLATIADEAGLRAATLAWLLSPSPPMLFMGEEFAAGTPFLYFCDFAGDLATAVREGRQREFSNFEQFAHGAALQAIPDPNAAESFQRSKLNWDCVDGSPHARWLELYQRLLKLRRDVVAPRLAGIEGHAGDFEVLAPGALSCRWRLGDGVQLRLWLNLSVYDVALTAVPEGALLACEPADVESMVASRQLPARSAVCYTLAKGR